MDTLRANLGNNSYNIYLDSDLLRNLHNTINLNKLTKQIFIITDENVGKLYLKDLVESLEGYIINSFIIKPGEDSKSLEIASEIYEKMLHNRCDRHTTIISLGGGVVGDLAGYVAATYMRGINFVQIPTTLLSQVDSSVGGKVAINFSRYKNIIGAFYQPKAVFIDIDVLKTLSNRELISGMGEVIKYGLIKDYDYFKWLDRNYCLIFELNKDVLTKIIIKSLELKIDVVEKDEREKNLRKILNFGHTIGHGIESLYNFKRYTHGEAVFQGMIFESYIGKKIGLIEDEYFKEIKLVLSKFVKPQRFDDDEIKQILTSITHDKKSIKGNPTFILPTGKGRVDTFTEIEERLIVKSLKEGMIDED